VDGVRPPDVQVVPVERAVLTSGETRRIHLLDREHRNRLDHGPQYPHRPDKPGPNTPPAVLAPAALVVADDVTFASMVRHLACARNPENGYVTVERPVGDGAEISCRVAAS
jgi:hypothetical protein